MMKKIFTMAALALLMTACSNNIDEPQAQQQPANPDGMITITAKLAPKSEAGTRAVETGKDSENKDIIKVKWAVDEHLAILYEVNETKYEADARITAVDEITGTATISFSVEEGTPDNTACTIVYPKSAAKDDHSGVKDATTLLAAQDGTLNANLDVRVGAGTISTSKPSLGVTTQPVAQFAIFKLTLKDIDGSADISATSVAISDQTGTVTTFTPASGYDKEMYVALPITATTLKILVTGSDSKKYFNMASGFTLGANYYQSTIKLATIGNVIASNGKCYKNKAATPGGNTAVAMIAYLGNESDCSNGLAAAMEDTKSEYGDVEPMKLSEANAVCSNLNTSLPITGGTWRLPTVTDFQYMIISCGSGQSYSDPTNEMTKNFQALADMLVAAGGSNYMENTQYLTRYGYPFVWILTFYNDFEAEFTLVDDNISAFVRACLAF